jgi:hypothetical protein
MCCGVIIGLMALLQLPETAPIKMTGDWSNLSLAELPREGEP